MSVSHPLAGLPSHSAKPAPQRTSHEPRVHTGVALARGAQTLSHRPQCIVLLCASTQLEPQRVVPIGQVATHVPLMHAWAAGQALPQAPQFKPSVKRLVQLDPQRVCPESHAGATPVSAGATPVSAGATPVSVTPPSVGRTPESIGAVPVSEGEVASLRRVSVGVLSAMAQAEMQSEAVRRAKCRCIAL